MATIQSLIQSAASGATITVPAGTYDVSGLVLPANITLQAGGNVTLVGNMTVSGSHSVISGFTFSGGNVDIGGSVGVTIENCSFNGGTGSILFNGARDAHIVDNDFRGVNGNVINGWGLDQSTISGNKFYDCWQCMNLDFNNDLNQGRDIVIADNYFTGTRRMPIELGPQTAYTSNLVVKGNWSENMNNAGPQAGWNTDVAYSIISPNGVNTLVQGNYASGPGVIGIELHGAGQVVGNYIDNFKYGAIVYGENFNVHDNAFLNASVQQVLNYSGKSGVIQNNQSTAAGFTMPVMPGTSTASAPVVAAALQKDTGGSATDHVTSNPALAGKADPNAVIHFTVDGTAIAATATADAAGKWAFTPTGLADGSHTVVASETSSAGIGKASITINLDQTAPAVTASLASSSTATNPVMAGTGDANAVVHFTVDGQAIDGTATANASGAWSYTPTGLSAGQHTVVASEVDLAGNTGKASVAVTVGQPPAPPSAPVPAISSGGPAVGGRVIAHDDTYKIAANQGLWIAQRYLTWNDTGPNGSGKNGGLTVTDVGAKSAQGFGVSFANGVIVYKAAAGWNGTDSVDYTVKDASGNAATAKILVTVGTGISSNPPPAAPPVVTAALLHDTGASVTDHITSDAGLGGTADPNATIRFSVDGAAVTGTAKADANGHWSYTPANLADGSHTVVASQTNAAGATGTASIAFDLQTHADTQQDAPAHDPAPDFTGFAATSSNVTISGTTGEAGDHVSIYFGSYLLGSATTASDGTFQVSGASLDGVTHIYNAVATSSDGHTWDGTGKFVLGSSGNCTLGATSGDDMIAGRGGNDNLIGGAGADRLTGGGGTDTYTYNNASDSTSASSDTITDFHHGTDKIDLTQIAGISASNGIPLFQGNISGSGNHTLNAHSVAFMEVGGQTVVLANTSGQAETVTSTDHHAADMKIVLTGVHIGLTATDFHHA